MLHQLLSYLKKISVKPRELLRNGQDHLEEFIMAQIT